MRYIWSSAAACIVRFVARRAAKVQAHNIQHCQFMVTPKFSSIIKYAPSLNLIFDFLSLALFQKTERGPVRLTKDEVACY